MEELRNIGYISGDYSRKEHDHFPASAVKEKAEDNTTAFKPDSYTSTKSQKENTYNSKGELEKNDNSPAKTEEKAKAEENKSNEPLTSKNENELSSKEKQEVKKLQARDAEVRSHEAAHVAAGGSLVRGGASFEYTRGPDGRQYATGGEVSIDISKVADDPQKTIDKMQQVRRAALAPADPSAQDRRVASRASRVEAKARQELIKLESEEKQENKVTADNNKDDDSVSNENTKTNGYTNRTEKNVFAYIDRNEQNQNLKGSKIDEKH